MKKWKCFMNVILFALITTCFIIQMIRVGFDIRSLFLIISAIIWLLNTEEIG